MRRKVTINLDLLQIKYINGNNKQLSFIVNVKRMVYKTFIIMKNKRLIIIIAIVALLLLIPLTAMQFTDEVRWTLFDFIVAAGLLLSAGLTLDFIIRKVKRAKYRIVLSVALVAILLLIWAELAVGIFGTPFAGS